ncbi:MAG: energy transducer TonB [Candidatus Cloacimonadaceae bacterium]|jgi:protein TonB|nr:energy transducer TonB [Candidatus Cloacimonadota bacterium]MDY0127609.1 energy transducer TonB [Candidatus Cloacimonadaceae bacterium]MCB5254940.1 energy transducer TonB [Candidatus Cloacimonadota bacterium]MCK9178040.1 energy transducer TonB [Candidatus Cloacimonadota bacterium]MCK9243177.1 energy transducer TonB [Candidatus Cloacimonadota bacterium]
MKQPFKDWKDQANSQFSKALALSLTILLFAMMVTPKIEVRKQVFKTQQLELVDIPMEEREKIEPPETEVEIDIPLVISDVLGTEEVDLEAYEAAREQIGNINITTSSSLSQDREELIDFVPYDDAPVVIGKISPVYPEFAKRNKVQGKVVLEVEVLKDGSVRDIRVKRSVGGGLDEAAIEAVRKIRFQPGKSSGVPVDVLLIIPVEFTLK